MPASEVRVPRLGESVVEATVGAWLKREGDAVEAGEPLVQLETEKVNVDVSAERSGVLERIDRREGDTVQPGDVLALLGDTAGLAPPASAEVGGATGSPSPSGSAEPIPQDRPHASPVARRLAEDHGLDLAQVVGSGTGGRVTREDVERHLGPSGGPAGLPDSAPQAVANQTEPSAVEPAGSGDAPAGTSAAPVAPSDAPPGDSARDKSPNAERPAVAPASRAIDPRGEERQRLSRRRLTIAQRLIEAQSTAAMLTTFNEVDMTAVMELRTRRRDAFKERHGTSLGFMSFFTKAVVGALKAFPRLNAEIQGDEMVLKRYYDVGIAVGAAEGLVVPVVRDADRKSFAEIEREIAQLGEKARTNTLTLDDLRGGTFTITNGGVFGSLLSTPILSTPQVGILGMHAIKQRPVVVSGEVVARPMMYLALTYDHRLVDGREAVQFLVRIKDLIEDPETLLLEG